MNLGCKRKTLACFLSVLGGALGLHRFYLYGLRDFAGWGYLAASILYLAVLLASFASGSLAFTVAALFPIPAFVSAIEGLAIGLTEDAKWDRKHNVHSPHISNSGWPLAVLLVLTLAITFTGFVASMARATDLLFTGGSFG